MRSAAFEEKSRFLVTAGDDHLDYWFLKEASKPRKSLNGPRESFFTHETTRKKADLSKPSRVLFIGVECSQGRVLALSVTGYIHVFDHEGQCNQTKLATGLCSVFSFAASSDYLICGGTFGTVVLRSTNTLKRICTLTRPPTLESMYEHVEAGESGTYADVIALSICGATNQLLVVYSDRTVSAGVLVNLHSRLSYGTSANPIRRERTTYLHITGGLS